ncbi:MAG: LysE family transporter [Opitutaceae bacterium]
MLEGITTGLIMSLTLFPGAVWLAKVGIAGGLRQTIAVGLGLWLSQLAWLMFAIPGLMMMYKHLHFMHAGMHLFAAFVLVYMALKFFRTKRVEQLDDVEGLPSSLTLFRTTFNQSFSMPMRLPAAMAILLATGTYINHDPIWGVVPSIALGALIGVTWWWGQFTFLAIFFAKRVSYPITIKSLNKLRPFCAATCLCLAVVSVLLGVSR